jgi:hypothetical protein
MILVIGGHPDCQLKALGTVRELSCIVIEVCFCTNKVPWFDDPSNWRSSEETIHSLCCAVTTFVAARLPAQSFGYCEGVVVQYALGCHALLSKWASAPTRCPGLRIPVIKGHLKRQSTHSDLPCHKFLLWFIFAAPVLVSSGEGCKYLQERPDKKRQEWQGV